MGTSDTQPLSLWRARAHDRLESRLGKGLNGIVNQLLSASVPKRWFSHLYHVAAFWNFACLCLLCLSCACLPEATNVTKLLATLGHRNAIAASTRTTLSTPTAPRDACNSSGTPLACSTTSSFPPISSPPGWCGAWTWGGRAPWTFHTLSKFSGAPLATSSSLSSASFSLATSCSTSPM